MKLKRLTASVIAAGLLTYALSPLGVFAAAATSYHTCDVNRDGKVTSADTLCLSRNLQGLDYKSNPAVLDVDKNNIVSFADAACLSSYLMTGGGYSNYVDGWLSPFSYGTSTAVSPAGAATQQTYVKRNGITKNETYYTISLQEEMNASSDFASPDGIIGDDTRVPQRKMTGIVKIGYSNSDIGTGFIVGDHHIVTAAHCVYNRSTKDWWNVAIWFSKYDGTTDQSRLIRASEIHIPKEFKDGSTDARYDYALITVNNDLSDYDHFQLGIPYNMYSSAPFSGYDLYVTGLNQNGDSYQLFTGVGQLYANAGNGLITFNTDADKGSEGGPVYVKENYEINGTTTELNTVIGIYSYEASKYNGGPAITPIMIAFFTHNKDAIY